jgi:hypothetical protein
VDASDGAPEVFQLSNFHLKAKIVHLIIGTRQTNMCNQFEENN